MRQMMCHISRSKIIFVFLLFYACATCAVTCILLWQASMSNSSSSTFSYTSSTDLKQSRLVYLCANNSAESSGNCDVLDQLQLGEYISSGWTKVVHQASYAGETVAVKTINLNGKHFIDCLKIKSFTECHNAAVDILATEIKNLQMLAHPNVVRLKAYCMKTVLNKKEECLKEGVIVTELGNPVSNIKLLQFTWKKRLRLLQDLLNLLQYLSYWSAGPIALLDLRRTQFVLVQNHIKLTDVDNVRIGDPPCETNADCSNQIGGTNVSVKCNEGRCLGFNEQFNIAKAFLEFGPYLLIKSDLPVTLRPLLDEIRAKFSANNSTTNELTDLVNQLLAY